MDASGKSMNPAVQRDRDKTVGDYILTTVLGEGQFGKVRLGTHRKTGMKVAVKCIAKKKLSPRTARMVQREVAIHKVLKHRHIAEILDVIETAKNLYLVMEYCEGGEIYHHLVRRGKMSESQARVVVRQMIEALCYCHDQNIAHRDLKLENVLLDKDLNVKITDFGFANTWRSGDLLRTFCGSPNYAAPEIVMGRPYMGSGVDVWSLGVMMYVLVVGRLPYDSTNIDDLFRSIRTADYVVKPYFSAEFLDLLRACMNPDVDQRWTTDQLRTHPWVVQGYGPVPHQMNVESTILDKMSDLGFHRLKVLDALRQTANKQKVSQASREMVVTYTDLLRKHRSQTQGDAVLHPDGLPTGPEGSSEMLPQGSRDSPPGATRMPAVHKPSKPTWSKGLPNAKQLRAAENLTRNVLGVDRYSVLHFLTRDPGYTGPPALMEALTILRTAAMADPTIAMSGSIRNLSVSNGREENEGRQRGPRGGHTRPSTSAPTSPHDSHTSTGNVDDEVVPRISLAFGVLALYSCPPRVLLDSLSLVLLEMHVDFELNGWVISCYFQAADLRFEVEICQVPVLSKCGLRMKCLSASSAYYDETVALVISTLEDELRLRSEATAQNPGVSLGGAGATAGAVGGGADGWGPLHGPLVAPDGHPYDRANVHPIAGQVPTVPALALPIDPSVGVPAFPVATKSIRKAVSQAPAFSTKARSQSSPCITTGKLHATPSSLTSKGR